MLIQMCCPQVQTDAGNDDQTLKRAIEASLKDFIADDADPFPFEETVREGGRLVWLLRSKGVGRLFAFSAQLLYGRNRLRWRMLRW